jgi:putative FmdB family regulatory protein
MPVYEYQCKACGHEFEREQRIRDKPVKKCPSCGALQAKRLISRTSFLLKGGGWYSDLYGSSKPKEASGGDAAKGEAKSGDGESPSKTSSEKAPAEKSAGKSEKADKGKASGKTKAQAAA